MGGECEGIDWKGGVENEAGMDAHACSFVKGVRKCERERSSIIESMIEVVMSALVGAEKITSTLSTGYSVETGKEDSGIRLV